MGRSDQPETVQVFLSYARADGDEVVTRLTRALNRAEIVIRQEVDAPRGSDGWHEQVRVVLGEVDAVLVLLSPAALASADVTWEWESALALHKPVLPLLAAPCDMPPALAQLDYYQDLSDSGSFALGLAALLRDLHGILTAQQTQQEEAVRTSIGPYPVLGVAVPQVMADDSASARIRLLLNGDVAGFEAEALVAGLSAMLDVPPELVRVLHVRAGSVQVEVLLPLGAANELYEWAAELGLLLDDPASSDDTADSGTRRAIALPLPDVPQTGREAPPLPRAELARLLAVRHREDFLDLFANDPDPDIRELGRLALRRKPADINDQFALGDLCAQRTLIDDQLRVFYAGKTLTAYQKAASRAEHDLDRQMAEQAIAHFAEWVAEVALHLPAPRNVAVALWVAADLPPEEQLDGLQDTLLVLLRQYPVRRDEDWQDTRPRPVRADGGWHAPVDIRETLPADSDFEATAFSAAPVPPVVFTDTEDDLDVADVHSSEHDLPGAERGAADSPVADQPDRAEGAFSAVDMPYAVARQRATGSDATATSEDEFWPGDRIEDRYEVVQALRGG
ncbi:MAG: toll/interleukin-1 receptor domain-containing protein, partial [Anaerolineae bacterium]|nr:toll/interleukin-1 receptor domain-containing protein [Anaerolineae bacterium]